MFFSGFPVVYVPKMIEKMTSGIIEQYPIVIEKFQNSQLMTEKMRILALDKQ